MDKYITIKESDFRELESKAKVASDKIITIDIKTNSIYDDHYRYSALMVYTGIYSSRFHIDREDVKNDPALNHVMTLIDKMLSHNQNTIKEAESKVTQFKEIRDEGKMNLTRLDMRRRTINNQIEMIPGWIRSLFKIKLVE